VYKIDMFMRNKVSRNRMHNLSEIFKQQKSIGKSQKEAAKILKLDHRSVSRHMKQKNIGYDLLCKYADYLEVEVFDLVAPVLKRQIGAYIKNNIINYYKPEEERPTLRGVFATSWWWSDLKTLMVIDKNDPKGFQYNQISFFSEWKKAYRITNLTHGLYKVDKDESVRCGYLERLDDDIFYCRDFYDDRYNGKTKVSNYARYICTYNLDDLPMELI